MTFAEYVAHYQLARSEGLVLRYLADAYRALRQTVPEEAQDRGARRHHRVAGRAGPPGRLQPARRVGAAGNPGEDAVEDGRPPLDRAARRRSPPTARAFRVLVRNALFRRVELAALRRLGPARRAGRATAGWDAERWQDALEPYFDEHDDDRHRPGRPRPAAAVDRRRSRERWLVRQILDDPAGDHDWAHHRRGRPGGVGRGGRRGGLGDRGGAARRALSPSAPGSRAAYPEGAAPVGAPGAGATHETPEPAGCSGQYRTPR